MFITYWRSKQRNWFLQAYCCIQLKLQGRQIIHLGQVLLIKQQNQRTVELKDSTWWKVQVHQRWQGSLRGRAISSRRRFLEHRMERHPVGSKRGKGRTFRRRYGLREQARIGEDSLIATRARKKGSVRARIGEFFEHFESSRDILKRLQFYFIRVTSYEYSKSNFNY